MFTCCSLQGKECSRHAYRYRHALVMVISAKIGCTQMSGVYCYATYSFPSASTVRMLIVPFNNVAEWIRLLEWMRCAALGMQK